MTLRTRRTIFYTLVALFILVGGGVVFYAQGWRLDFASWRFEKIGGIYVRAYPENASIFLNGKPEENQAGFLSPGTLISDLLPQTYSVVLKAPGYDTWQENAAVLPSLVTQFKHAVLVPATSTPVASSTARQITLAMATGANITSSTNPSAIATTTNPFDANQKIIFGKNEISLFDIAAATTSASAAISGKNISVKWISGNVAGVLQDDSQLYLYDTNAQTLTKLADNVKYFSATDDGSMVAALEHNSLEIFSLNDASIYYRFNLPNIASAQQVIWYHDDNHLFVVYPDSVSFLDLADAGLKNFTTVAQGTKPFYNPQANVLYITTPETKNAKGVVATAGKMIQYDFPN